MARQRLVKPAFFKHRGLYDAEQETGLPLRLAYEGLWCQADRRGVFRWKATELKLDILPYDPVDFEAVLTALADHGFVFRYVVGEKMYGLIPTFSDHQTFHRAEKPSADPMPAPGQHRASPMPAPGRPRLASDNRESTEHLAGAAITPPAPSRPGASTGSAPCQPGASTPVTVTVTDTGTVAVAVTNAVAVDDRPQAQGHRGGVLSESPHPPGWVEPTPEEADDLARRKAEALAQLAAARQAPTGAPPA